MDEVSDDIRPENKIELDRCYLFANRSHKVKLLVVLLGVMSSTFLFEWKLSGRVV
jgi:hypothetical protein